MPILNFKQQAYNLLAQKNELLQNADAHFTAGNMEAYDSAMEAVKGLDTQIERIKEAYEQSQKDYGFGPMEAPKAEGKKEEKQMDSSRVFAKAIRDLYRGKLMVSDTTDSSNNGTPGYTVPQDIETRIRTYREDTTALIDYVTAETTTMSSGRFIYQDKASLAGFSPVNEAATIGQLQEPTFTPIPWSVQKYAGILPVTNELLNDSDENITNLIVNWMGRERVKAQNAAILAKVKATGAAQELNDLDGIRTALNVTLGQLYKPYSYIITNDNGLDYLDQLKDTNGRYQLNPDPTDSAAMQLRAGANLVKVIALPNAVLANTDAGSSTTLPFIVGDLKSFLIAKLMKGLTIDVSREGSVGSLNAWSQDLTMFRGIYREGYTTVDSDAIVFGKITPA